MAFTSQAISSQGVRVAVEVGDGTSQQISNITNAAPAVVTDTAHGLNSGDVVYMTGVGTGAEYPSINGKSFPIRKVTVDTFQLVGSDASAEPTVETEGQYTVVTWYDLCEAKTFQGFDGQASEIDVTTLCSTAKEYRLGLQDFGSFSFDMNLVPNDTGQLALEAAKASGDPLWFRVELPNDGGAYVFRAFVRQKSISGGVDSVLSSSVSLRITGEPVFVAVV